MAKKSKKNNFYAVKVGKNKGIYRTWDECQEMVKGFPGAVHKGFPTEEMAQEWLDGKEVDEPKKDKPSGKTWKDEVDMVFMSSHEAIAYVDGSYNERTKEYGYGGILLTVRGKQQFSGKGDREDMVKHQNVSGELTGAYILINEAIKQGIKTLYLHHDYKGIEAWITGEWKANIQLAKYYIEYFEMIKHLLHVEFIHTPSHTGIALNEEVDKLAKQAIGLK